MADRVFRIDETPGLGRLGRQVRHDPRSLNFLAPRATTLRTKMHRHWGGVLDQGALGSCTGNAISQALNTVPLRAGRRLLTEDDARRLYSAATRLDPWPGEWPTTDTGSSGLAVCQAARAEGLISGYDWAFGLDHALAALALAPVITGTDWYDSMDRPSSGGLVHIAGDVRGGHEFAVTGIDVVNKRVRCLNSWGPNWGVNGTFWLTWDDWGLLLSHAGDVTVPRL